MNELYVRASTFHKAHLFRTIHGGLQHLGFNGAFWRRTVGPEAGSEDWANNGVSSKSFNDDDKTVRFPRPKSNWQISLESTANPTQAANLRMR